MLHTDTHFRVGSPQVGGGGDDQGCGLYSLCDSTYLLEQAARLHLRTAAVLWLLAGPTRRRRSRAASGATTDEPITMVGRSARSASTHSGLVRNRSAACFYQAGMAGQSSPSAPTKTGSWCFSGGLLTGWGSAAVPATVSWLCQQINQVKRRSEGGKPDIKPSPGGGSGVRRTNQQPPLRGVSADQHADQDLLHIRETRVQGSQGLVPAGFSVLPHRKCFGQGKRGAA